MLRFLAVKRLAIIDSIEVDFAPGLNILTGETGAGKSILIEAVGLLLGGRASGELVRTGEDSAAIEALFESGGEELIVRREINAQGRSRAFINGELATAGALKELSSRLVELHGQHEHHTLLDPSTHLDVLDTFGNLQEFVAPTASAYESLRSVEGELARLRSAAADRNARAELVEFQLSELDRAAPKPGEDEELAASRQVLASAERVRRLCAESYGALYEDDAAILSGLGAVWRRVAELATLDPRFRPYLDTRDPIKAQLEDLAVFLRRYSDGLDASAERLQLTEDRLAVLERLKRKHGPTLQEVIARRDALRSELAELEGSDETLARLEKEALAAQGEYLACAQELTSRRRRAGRDFSRALVRLLGELAMEHARFEVRFNGAPLPAGSWTARGIDEAEFFVSANPGEDLRPLAKIVSGGELSRIMLGVKTLTAGSRLGFNEGGDRPPSAGAPGLIFDEIDAGIGGRVADVVGRKLRGLGSAFQVLCITHLPQIASYADSHFRIEKRVERGRTRTTVVRLTDAGRVEELARMLGGASVTDCFRASAREMLAEARRGDGNGPVAPGEVKGRGESERAKAKVGPAGGELPGPRR